MAKKKCDFSIDPVRFLNAREDDVAGFVGYDELRQMSLAQLERLADEVRVEKGAGFSRNKNTRRSQLIRALVEFQRRNRNSLRHQANQALKMEEMFRRLMGIAQAREAGEEATDPASPVSAVESEFRADPGVIQRFANAIPVLQSARRRKTAQVTKERKNREAVIQGILNERRMIQPGEVSRILHDQMADQYMGSVIQENLKEGDLEALVNHLVRHPDLRDKSGLRKLGASQDLKFLVRDGIIPDRSTVRLFGRVFGPQIQEALESERSFGSKAREVVARVWNIPRAAITAFDVSYTLRQAFGPFMAHPVRGIQELATSLKVFANKEVAEQKQVEMEEDSDWLTITKTMGVSITDVGSATANFSQQEEEFVTDWFEKMERAQLRGLGKILMPLKLHSMGVTASNRAYVTYLNRMRFDLAKNMLEQIRREGYDIKNPNELELKELQKVGQFINAATGRGNIRSLSNPIINGLFFAPRFVASRVEHIVHGARILASRGSPQAARKEALRELIAVSTLYSSIFFLIGMAASAFDWEDEVKPPSMNPFDSDFLKVDVAGTRIDVGAGYGQIIRTLTAAMSGLARPQGNALYFDYQDGEIKPVKGSGNPFDWWTRVTRELGLYKLSPFPSFVVSVGRGQFVGDRKAVTPARAVSELLVPISVQEVADTINYHGWLGSAFIIPEVLGLGTLHIGERGAGVDNSLSFPDRALGKVLFGDPAAFNPDRGPLHPVLGQTE